jgi:hypothetical protein
MINGTEGVQFAPRLGRTTRLAAFVDDLQRSSALVPDQKLADYKGISVQRCVRCTVAARKRKREREAHGRQGVRARENEQTSEKRDAIRDKQAIKGEWQSN